MLREGDDLLIVGFGPIVMRGVESADRLAAEGWSVAVIDARFAKPLDRELILTRARGKQLVVTLEESASPVASAAACSRCSRAGQGDAALRAVPVLRIGIPAERFVDHGAVADLRRVVRLDADGIARQIREALATVGARARRTSRRSSRPWPQA